MAKTTTKSPKKAPSKAPAKATSGASADAPFEETPAPKEPKSTPFVGTPGGKNLVIVESPTKAKTINKYLGKDYVVMASVGHVRDLPARAPKGVKQLVPGVDLEHDFKPAYEIMPDKKKTISELKRAAKGASNIWFATDLDREGEAIAWHLAHALDVKPSIAKRVVFNAITKAEIQNAFMHPRPIDENKVNAQQARRILDRIVGYQVSPLLWKKVAGGLSAGRVQSVGVRVVVEREREIEKFIPEEFWKVNAYFTPDLLKAGELSKAWTAYLKSGKAAESTDAQAEGEDGTDSVDLIQPRSVKEKTAWLNEHKSFKAELSEIDGKAADLVSKDQTLAVVQKLGFKLIDAIQTTDEKAKGPAKNKVTLNGVLANAPRYAIKSITTKRVQSRPYAPFITSTLQQAASNRMGFPLQRTMRIAQQLYEGIDLKGDRGPTGLITYMRTDSTHLSGEALNMVRGYISKRFGAPYLPEKPNFFSSSNKAAQEAHEAIRPTDVTITPDSIRGALSDEQFKLYKLIWERFVSCQMTSAQWDSTQVMIEPAGVRAAFKANGRTLVFDGFYKVTGVPGGGEEPLLPELAEGQQVAPLDVEPLQGFTSPPPRYTEASLQKKLEEEGIGRPSTYAAIIQTIQDRKYVEAVAPRDRRLRATDLGKVVTDKLVEGFPQLLDVGYTRKMEKELDQVEEEHKDWVSMLHEFYGPFKMALESAQTTMTHAKAVMEPAPHKCPKCGAGTVYRFGKNGRFLSCATYPACDYAAPINAEGNPVVAEASDIACPICGTAMNKRSGRFGPFLSCPNYPTCKGVVNLDRKKGTVVAPKVPALIVDVPCTKCGSPLAMRSSKRGPWLSCSTYPKCKGRLGWSTLTPEKQKELEIKLANHEAANPRVIVKTVEGKPVPENYVPVTSGGGEPEEKKGESYE
jgi:DNA topoisomerase I